MSELYPYKIPNDMHPLAWTLLGFGLDAETLNSLSVHLYDKLGVTPPEEKWKTYTLGFAVDRPRFVTDTRLAYSVGESFTHDVPYPGAVVAVHGDLPPGLVLDTSNKRITGTFTTAGGYEVTIKVGPLVKYDALGTAGGPTNIGQWIDINSDRVQFSNGLEKFDPTTVDDLDPRAKDELLARLLADSQARATAINSVEEVK